MSLHIPTSLRRFVVERAAGRCEYCLLHENDVPFSHQVDHIIPRKHSGQTTRDNLALACFECNRYKGSDLTTIDPLEGTVVLLFNPRVQVWTEHFMLETAYIVGITPIGRATASLLRFNRWRRVVQRQALINIGRYP
jgi:hypothetical protein